MAVPKGQSVVTSFAPHFVCTDLPDASSPDFGGPLPETKWCLLELTKAELAQLESGAEFFFKPHGGSGGTARAALCAPSKTYSLEFLENSNSIFLGALDTAPAPRTPTEAEGAAGAEGAEGAAAPAGAASETTCTIFGQVRGNLIVKPEAPDAKRVHELLAANPVGSEGSGAQMTLAALQHAVAASPAELKTILEEGPYFEQDGIWKHLPAALEREILDIAVTVTTAQGWQLGSVDLEVLLEAVRMHLGTAGAETIPSTAAFRKALRSVVAPGGPAAPGAEGTTEKEGTAPQAADGGSVTDAAPAAAGSEEGAAVPPAGASTIALDAEKIKRFHALQLLHERPARVRERFELPPPPPRQKRARLGSTMQTTHGQESPILLSELVTCVQRLCDADTNAEEVERLLGLQAHVDVLDGGAVHPLDTAALPQDPRGRLRRLFELQSHWNGEQIAALLGPVLGGQKVETWLMKHTRAVHIEVEKGKPETRLLVKKFGGLS